MFENDCFLNRLMSERETSTETYSVEVTVCEIYNNDVRDLLSDKSTRVRI